MKIEIATIPISVNIVSIDVNYKGVYEQYNAKDKIKGL